MLVNMYTRLSYCGFQVTFDAMRNVYCPMPYLAWADGVAAPDVTWNPQYDNLVYMLTNNYELTYGVDFTYGLVELGGGLWALQLTFVPEPSTVLLLGLGGLMVWRRWAKRTVAK